jgi:hypothetical protein
MNCKKDMKTIRGEIFQILREAAKDPRRGDSDAYYEYKKKLLPLVGWYAENEFFKTQKDFERIIFKLSDVIGI